MQKEISFDLRKGRNMSKESLSGLKVQVVELIDSLRGTMFPEIFDFQSIGEGHEGVDRETARELLKKMLLPVLKDESKVLEVTDKMMDSLPGIKDVLMTDVRAAYEGDPAAISEEEVMLAYPAFEAISIFRLAHKLYELKVPILPRMMTEHAHKVTGIDIHPGASIGRYFFIDHGTGVVIGETTTIGEHVKLYQGVTLGAKSFDVKPDGSLVKGIKRHPDIGNNVVIYAGATVLGGNTSIGDDCIIGGNVWLTHSVQAGSKVVF